MDFHISTLYGILAGGKKNPAINYLKKNEDMAPVWADFPHKDFISRWRVEEPHFRHSYPAVKCVSLEPRWNTVTIIGNTEQTVHIAKA